MKLDPWQKLMQRGPGADPTSSQLEELGFSLLDPSVGLSGSFYTVNLYAIRGLSAPDEVIVSNGGIQGNSKVRFGIGRRCNELANRMIGLDFVDDEDQWSADDRHRPPFLLLQIRSSKSYRAESGYCKNDDGQIVYERKMFAHAHREVQAEAEKLTHKALGAIALCISPSAEIYLDHLKKVYFGMAESGEVLKQLPSFQLLFELTKGVKGEDLQNALDTAASLTHSNKSRSTYLLGLGLEERDVVKRFLFFFLAIESEVSRVFKSLSSPAFVGAFGSPLEQPSADLVHDVVKSRNNDLLVKFLWCMKTELPQLSFDDLRAFKELKTIRDGVAHGSFEKLPGQEEADKAYKLATRVLASN
jgi:hypothetical protein